MSTTSDNARHYSREHATQFRQELHEMLRIPSLSADPAHAADIQRMAEWLIGHLNKLGVQNVQLMPTAGHPVVYGEWLGAGSDRPTVLVYGHYDVVPAEMEDGWLTSPFEPIEKDGLLYARGASDDKGQLFIHIKALESYLKTSGAAPVNLKFFLEGEEEIASPNMASFIKEHLDLLSADLCVISDSAMPAIDRPAILHSLRGITYIEVTVQGSSDDIHSGNFGGAVHNPALALVEILSRLHNPDHSVAVPGFYDDVVALTAAERKELAKTGIAEDQIRQMTGVSGAWGEADYTIRERISARPTLEINGLLSGWTGPGPKTVIPATAMAKISCRLVGNQDPHKIYQQLRTYIESLAPPTVSVKVTLVTTGEPALISYAIPQMQAAVRAYEKAWGATPIFTRGGGSIPVVAEIYNQLHIPIVMMGYGLDDDGFHGPNERLTIEMFHRGIETAIVYLQEMADLQHSAS